MKSPRASPSAWLLAAAKPRLRSLRRRRTEAGKDSRQPWRPPSLCELSTTSTSKVVRRTVSWRDRMQATTRS